LQPKHDAETNDHAPFQGQMAKMPQMDGCLQRTGNRKYQHDMIDEITGWGGKERYDMAQKLTHSQPPALFEKILLLISLPDFIRWSYGIFTIKINIIFDQ
jgi:hypothetical protein